MKYVYENGTLTIALCGHIDSSNSAETEKELEVVRAANPAENIVLECSGLTYISSAGLRVILRLKKAVKDLLLINVSADVYGIFELTGFTDMINIKKALRTVSVKGCEIIGEGANGVVYKLDRETIVKVFRDENGTENIERERELARTAFVLGIPTAIPYDVVMTDDGHYGSVYELLDAKSYSKLISSGELTPAQAAKQCVNILRTVHSSIPKAGILPSAVETHLRRIERAGSALPDDLRAKLNGFLVSMPENPHMIHGDFHIKNIMVQNGESLLIDMDTLSVGDPVFELAAIYNAYMGFTELDRQNAVDFMGITYEAGVEIWNNIFDEYFAPYDKARRDAAYHKIRALSAAVMIYYTAKDRRHTPEFNAARIELNIKHLREHIAYIDTLCL